MLLWERTTASGGNITTGKPHSVLQQRRKGEKIEKQTKQKYDEDQWIASSSENDFQKDDDLPEYLSGANKNMTRSICAPRTTAVPLTTSKRWKLQIHGDR